MSEYVPVFELVGGKSIYDMTGYCRVIIHVFDRCMVFVQEI